MSFDIQAAKASFDKVIGLFESDLKTVKTGRAKPALVEEIKIEAYGSMMPLKELASITAPDPHMILIQPWDRSVIEAISKALQTASTPFNPAVDGTNIRVAVPALTGEKREELIKLVSQKLESHKQLLRNERTEQKKKIDASKGGPGVSEDDLKANVEQLDKVSHEYVAMLEDLCKKKQDELRTI